MTDSTAPMSINIVSGVSLFDGNGYCQVQIERDDGGIESLGQLSPDETRAMALAWLQAAEASENDAALLAVCRELGIDYRAAGRLIDDIREQRKPK